MVDAVSATRTEGILPLGLPADAADLWVGDAVLAHRLGQAGYRLVDRRPDVAIVASAEDLEQAPSAPAVVAVIDGLPGGRKAGGRGVAAVERLRAHAVARASARSVTAALRRRGLAEGQSLMWDDKMTLECDPSNRPPTHSPQRYPRRALVTAGDVRPTLLEQALRDAQRAVDARSSPQLHRIALSEGSVVAMSDLGVLRVGLGAGRGQVERPAEALRALARRAEDTSLARLLPELWAVGNVGPLAWSLEGCIEGRLASLPLTEAVWQDCIDTQAQLHALPSDIIAPAPSLAELGVRLAPLARDPEQVVRLAEAAEDHLRPLRAGVNHGDFWSENLLVAQGRLAGVIDWDSATGGGLPFVDLLHMYTAALRPPGFDTWGRTFTEGLLPWCVQGGDARLRRYADLIGLEPTPALLHTSAIAYWLSHIGYQVSRYAQRSQDKAWVDKSVDRVAEVLARSGSQR